ncbi:MAG: flagellar basal body P-ring formation chaperone FlgA [Maritimibacter sp.]
MKVAATCLAILLALPADADTVVAARNLRSQSIITAQDVKVIPDDVPGSYIALEEVLGQEARVVLYAGRPIRIEDVGPPAIVDRNQIVTVLFHTGALQIAAEGRSLSRGGIGDRVRIMNLSSRQIITGFVREDGQIVVGASHNTTNSNLRTN